MSCILTEGRGDCPDCASAGALIRYAQLTEPSAELHKYSEDHQTFSADVSGELIIV